MSFAIDTFRPSDADAVSQLWSECLVVHQPWNEPNETISRQQSQQPNGFFVGRLDEQLIGTCIAGYDGVRGWLYRVVVSPQHRGKGFGGQLIDHAERYLSELGCAKVNLQILASNDGAIRFYEAQDYYRQDHFSMAKILSRNTSEGKPHGHASANRSAKIETFTISDGICLTSFQWSDKPFLCNILNESEIYARYTTLPHPYTESHADAWLQKWCAPTRQQLAADRVWAIRDRNECLIGAIGLHQIETGHAAELGYWLSTTSWGGGVATRAVDCICRFALGEFGLVRIAAEVVVGNVASVRVLQKNGFEKEGLQRRARKYGNTHEDIELFSRLRDASTA